MHLITNGFETTQHLKIKNSKIDVFFKEVITSEQAGIMKPHAAIFEYALSKTHAEANTSIMIGDTLDVDILGAINAGIDSAYFNPAQPPTAAIQPTYVLGGLMDLKNIL
jgi:putative hydrolase of the HAD superfamily